MRTLPDDDTGGVAGSDPDREGGADRQASGDGAAGRYRIQALDRALGILALVGRRPDLGLQALAERSGTSVSQVLKILATLEGHGLVAKGADKTYRLGYGAMRLGHLAARLQPVVGVAALVLDELREETGESIHLVVRDGLDAVIADVRESSKTVRVVSPVGERTRLNAGSAGKLFLAHGSRELMAWLVSEPMPAYTELSETDPGVASHRRRSCEAAGRVRSDRRLRGRRVLGRGAGVRGTRPHGGRDRAGRTAQPLRQWHRTTLPRGRQACGLDRGGAPGRAGGRSGREAVEDAGVAPDPTASAV